ncbi:MAG: hypothetical protein HDR11_09865 [Lachnospiraceae bacterium]|nr:hypothetical protein [Lachnospiraceae bacterium]
MKRRIFIVLGIISILICLFGLYKYHALGWLVFLVLGIYFLYPKSSASCTDNTLKIEDTVLSESSNLSIASTDETLETNNTIENTSSSESFKPSVTTDKASETKDTIKDTLKSTAVSETKAKKHTELEKSFTFPIVGVTFSNEDGTKRQTILKKIYFKDAPFDIEQNVTLERYLWKNEPAYYVKVNNIIVGNISADFVWYFEKISSRKYEVAYINVYGGGRGKNWGAEIHGIFLDVDT